MKSIIQQEYVWHLNIQQKRWSKGRTILTDSDTRETPPPPPPRSVVVNDIRFSAKKEMIYIRNFAEMWLYMWPLHVKDCYLNKIKRFLGN